MKLLVTTRADKNIKNMTDLTHSIIRCFARKWGADFSVLSHMPDCEKGNGRYHYRIMKLNQLLTDYERILVIDSDVVINKTCPNIFEVVPHDKIGSIYEDKGSRMRNRRHRIALAQEKWGDIGWREGYINTGVFVVSRSHRAIFKKINNEYWTQKGFDDVHLGYQIHRLGFDIFELEFRYNHMSMFSESWNWHSSRFKSYIIHYAGRAKFPDKREQSEIQLIKTDIGKIYGY